MLQGLKLCSAKLQTDKKKNPNIKYWIWVKCMKGWLSDRSRHLFKRHLLLRWFRPQSTVGKWYAWHNKGSPDCERTQRCRDLQGWRYTVQMLDQMITARGDSEEALRDKNKKWQLWGQREPFPTWVERCSAKAGSAYSFTSGRVNFTYKDIRILYNETYMTV